MTGPLVSPTLTANEPVAVLLAWSVDEQLTGVEPIGNAEPEAGAQLTVTLLSRLSVTLAEYVTSAPALEVASAVMSDGRLREGAVLSMLIPLCVFEDALPARSAQVPVTDCPAPSVERVWLTVLFTGPETESEHAQLAVTFVLFQPFAL